VAVDARAFEMAGVRIRRVAGSRAIVGRSGKYIRRQLWGRVVVTALGPPDLLADADIEPDIP
jgi:hypothetical protein